SAERQPRLLRLSLCQRTLPRDEGKTYQDPPPHPRPCLPHPRRHPGSSIAGQRLHRNPGPPPRTGRHNIIPPPFRRVEPVSLRLSASSRFLLVCSQEVEMALCGKTEAVLHARQHFPGLLGKVFLDAACVSLAPRPAVEAIEKFLDLAMVCPLASST